MKVDSLSKECVTIGSITLVVSLILITIEVKELTVLQSDYSDANLSKCIQEHSHKLVIYTAGALFSILIIFGIKTRRIGLMAPWLLAAFAGVALSIFFYVGVLMTLPFARLEYLFYIIAMIGGESVVLYPVCALFEEIRRDRAKKLRRQAHLKSVTVK